MIDFKIGEPYSFRSFNCWHYVVKVREENGIKTKLFKTKNMTDAYNTITQEMQKLDHGLTKVDEPQNFDIIIVSRLKNNKKVYHCGLYFNGTIIHNSLQFKQVVSETFNDFIQNYNGFTLWR